MQYKQNTKIVIDKRKLDTLFRLGCPDSEIMSLIKNGTFKPTGDLLVDEILECLIDYKSFNNWGGYRENSGRKKVKINQDENQDENQDANQVVDIDIDIDNDLNNNINNNYIFNGKTIRLCKKDFESWKVAYPHINLEYELKLLDFWFQTQDEKKRKSWFWSTQSMLLKKENEKIELEKKESFKRKYFNGRS